MVISASVAVLLLVCPAAAKSDESNRVSVNSVLQDILQRDPLGTLSGFDLMCVPVITGMLAEDTDGNAMFWYLNTGSRIDLTEQTKKLEQAVTKSFSNIVIASPATWERFYSGSSGRIVVQVKAALVDEKPLFVLFISVLGNVLGQKHSGTFVATLYSSECHLTSLEHMPDAAYSLIEKMRKQFLEAKAARHSN